jgi:hypothetical protein
MRIRSRRDLKSGEEITIVYENELPHDYKLRRQILKEGHEFICACNLCKTDTTLSLPEGPLRKKALELADVQIFAITAFTNAELLDNIEQTIDEVLKSGFGYGAHPMKVLHQHAMQLHLSKNDRVDALKMALRIYFLIEPSMEPPELPEYRLATLVIIISFLTPGTSNSVVTIPPRISRIVKASFHHIYAKLVLDCEELLGADAKATKFEKAHFSVLKAELDRVNEMAGKNERLFFSPTYLSGQSEILAQRMPRNF